MSIKGPSDHLIGQGCTRAGHADTIAPGQLGLIHRLVRLINQAIRLDPMDPIRSHTDTRGDADLSRWLSQARPAIRR